MLPTMSSAEILPFRGNKPLPQRPGLDGHPLPWTYSNGFIWDANRRPVGSTIHGASAEWITRCVNGVHGHDTLPSEPPSDTDPA